MSRSVLSVRSVGSVGSVLLVLWVVSLASAAEPGFAWKPVNDKSLGLWEGEKAVLVYNHGMISKEGVKASYDRACYVHPLYGLDGEALTDDFPKDHLHHRGIFWAWPGMKVEGKSVQSWIPQGIYYKQERVIRQEATDKAATLEVENGWYVGEKKVVKEGLVITMHPAAKDSRAIDFDLTWTALDVPVTLWGAEGKSYGGFNIRFAPNKDEPNANKRKDTAIVTSLGPSKGKDVENKPLEWADLTGEVAGAPGRSGVAIFIAKDHPDFPPTWLTRHYGCLCVGWPGVKPKDLEPGKPVRCRYRVWVHRGEADLATLQSAYDAYAKGGER
jgi:hypothetical protein